MGKAVALVLGIMSLVLVAALFVVLITFIIRGAEIVWWRRWWGKKHE